MSYELSNSTALSSASGSRVPSPWQGRRLSSSASSYSPAAGTPSSSTSINPSPRLRPIIPGSSNSSSSRLGSSSSSINELAKYPMAASPSAALLGSSRSSISPRSFSPIHPEPDKRGNLEYKLRILPVTANRFSRLVTQLKWRLAEGNGLAVYEIGVLDDGTLIGLPKDEMKSSLTQLAMMGQALGATCEIRRCIVVQRSPEAQEDVEQEEFTQAQQDSTASTNGQSSNAEPSHEPPYRHRTPFSSKTQSAGLDNIVGLTSLNNQEATRLLGAPRALGWDVRIAESDSEDSEGDGDDSDELMSSTVDSTPSTSRALNALEASGAISSSANQTGHRFSPEQLDDEGFAFGLTLSDDDGEELPRASVPTAGTLSKSALSISNSPWKSWPPGGTSANSPQPPTPGGNLLTTHRAAEGTALVGSRKTATSQAVRPDQPSAERQETGSMSAEDDLEDANACPFSELAGMDVKGVLQFALDPGMASQSLTARRKKKSGRRRREEKHRVAMMLALGHPPEPDREPLPDTNEANEAARDELLDPVQAIGFTPEEVASITQAKAQKPAKPSKGPTREPRAERRARRLAEMKALERQGEGLLNALQADPTLSDEDRAQWWKFSGMTYEDHLPFWDSVRQNWVREVSDYLTVNEMLEMASSWDPTRFLREVGDEEPDGQLASSIPERSDEPIGALKSSSDTVNDSADAASSVTRKAHSRRRRKQKKRAAADQEAEQLAAQIRPVVNKSARPDFLPPPSNGVAIPRRQNGHHPGVMNKPLAPRQSMGSETAEEEDSEEEDSFSMGLTMNIDELSSGDPGATSNKVETCSKSVASSKHLDFCRSPASVSSASTAKVGSTHKEKGNALNGGLNAMREGILQDPNVRVIVEAVLSLESIPAARPNGTPSSPRVNGVKTVGGSPLGTSQTGETLAAEIQAEEDVANPGSSDDDSEFGVWEL
ncbi:unnamed protein product [Sympodiomycopsis kandeliae]